jgi:hypothetical protein
LLKLAGLRLSSRDIPLLLPVQQLPGRLPTSKQTAIRASILKQKSQKRLVLLTADDGTGQVGVRSMVQGTAVCKGEEPGCDWKMIPYIVEI